MNRFIGVLFFLAAGVKLYGQAAENRDYTQLVNPLIGTDSRYELSSGNTYPAIALPWGMNFWTPQTNRMGNGWCYQYASNKICGIKQTHQPSPWINDYGAFSVFATTGKLAFRESDRESWFSHKAEVSRPHYYKVYLASYDITAEVAPTERAAIFRLTYPKSNESYLILDAFFKNSYVRVIPNERKIVGYSCNSSGGTPDNFKCYFVAYVDKDFEEVYVAKNGRIKSGKLEVYSKHSGAVVRFKTTKSEQVHIRVASSFISEEQAELNLKAELGSSSFDDVCGKAKDVWNAMLGRIAVDGGTYDQQVAFYTALYRTMLFPRKFYEINRDGKIVHYSPYNGTVQDGYMFTDNGFWDTFRAVFPLFTLVFPELNSHIMEGLANTYRESGWLPEWASPGHRSCMVGSNSAVIIADSYLKGIANPSINLLYEAILKNTTKEGPIKSVGRYGVSYYNSLGYIPYDVGVNENVARTLEYAMADFTIAKLAKSLNRPDSEVQTFYRRAYSYTNVFDTSVGFMRGRNADGTFQVPFRPDKWGDAFTEGCSWHWTWCVFHDVAGLIRLMGGKERFVQMLDSVFVTPPTFDYSYYGSQIHEITEMVVMNMGQYAHGNQPIQHMPYLYCYAGTPWKTQLHVRDIMNKLYTAAPDGLCGDEDNGQTSAWYVFSAMGFYPVTSATGQYVIGSPLFSSCKIALENGRIVQINAPNNSSNSYYVDDIQLNGVPYTKSYITHSDLANGCRLDFRMADKPSYTRGTSSSDVPFSMSEEGL